MMESGKSKTTILCEYSRWRSERKKKRSLKGKQPGVGDSIEGRRYLSYPSSFHFCLVLIFGVLSPYPKVNRPPTKFRIGRLTGKRNPRFLLGHSPISRKKKPPQQHAKDVGSLMFLPCMFTPSFNSPPDGLNPPQKVGVGPAKKQLVGPLGQIKRKKLF